MKDHQLGYRPADDDRMLGNVLADVVDDFGVGIPLRVLDEWQARHDALMAKERSRTEQLRGRRINTECMTLGDAAGLNPPMALAPGVRRMIEQYVMRRQAERMQEAQNEYTDSLVQR